GRGQLPGGPVRARRAHVLGPLAEHARPVGDPAGEEGGAPADRGGPQPRHGQARVRAADGPGGAGGRRRRPARGGPPRPGPRDVRRGAVAGLRRPGAAAGVVAAAGRAAGADAQLMAKRQISLDSFTRAVAGLPRLRWEACALVKEVKGKPTQYLRPWIRTECPECAGDLTLMPGDDQTELARERRSYRTTPPGWYPRRVIRA